MQPNWRIVLCGTLLVASSFLLLVGKIAPAAPDATPTELPSGWKITPAGRVVDLAGDMPLRVLPLARGKALVLTGGYHDHSLSLVDVSAGKVMQTLELGKVWAGLAMDPSGSKVFVSGGGPLLQRFDRNVKRTPLEPVVRESLSRPLLRVALRRNHLAVV